MLYNTLKNLFFRGALSCNELHGSPEKLSTIGVEIVENFCPPVPRYGTTMHYICTLNADAV